MSETTYYQRSRETLNRAKEYYKKDRLRQRTKYKHREFSEEEKKLKKENMLEIDIVICLKKINKS